MLALLFSCLNFQLLLLNFICLHLLNNLNYFFEHFIYLLPTINLFYFATSFFCSIFALPFSENRLSLEDSALSPPPLVSSQAPPPSGNAPNPTAKVGFAAIQEMARLQEEALMRESSPEAGNSQRNSNSADSNDLSFLRFDPDANCLKLESYEFKPPMDLADFELGLGSAEPESAEPKEPSSKPVAGLSKFPLDVPTPTQSPPVGLRRFGSFRYIATPNTNTMCTKLEKLIPFNYNFTSFY